MQITLVSSQAHEAAFYKLPSVIYKNDTNWIVPLEHDVRQVFDAKKNKSFKFGKIERWILADETNNTIGRIAAFTNSKYKNKGDDVPVGGMGFFECINNQQAANVLFDTAKQWLQQQGVQAMDGPINFGERDNWWGLVTQGFYEPMYCMNYNPEYYVELFETYGFKVFYEQHCFGLKAKAPLEQKIWDRHAIHDADPNFASSHLYKDNLAKYANDFATVYNKAWAGHGGLKQMSAAQVLLLFKKMKTFMDPKLLWYVYYNHEPVAMFINIPDLNQWFKHLHGKFSLYHKLKFLWLKKFKKNKKFTGIVFGVVPEWQGKGVDAYIIGEAAKHYLQTAQSPYEDYEMQWIGDFNPKMINVASTLGKTYVSRKLCTYRYLFDSKKEFVRHPII
jgi:hypothetical protein